MSYVYSDYLRVNADFIPVFTEEADRQSPNRWKQFIPHRHFRDLLENTIRAIERGMPDSKKSLWIQGAYGTGKTFAVFTLKHLFEEDINTVREYLTRHNEVKNFCERFCNLRNKGNILTVFNSSVAHIRSHIHFLAQIQTRIRQSLTEKGMINFPIDIYDKLFEKLNEGIVNWEKIFQKHQMDFNEFTSHLDVIESLKIERNNQRDRNLLGRVIEILNSENVILMTEPKEIKEWIKNVIDKNNLQAIIFIWDEFTDFFNQRDMINTLQEISHASTEIPFYFLLVTHRNINQMFSQRGEIKKIEERFHVVNFEMQPITAYKLIANTIEIKEEKRENWLAKRETLWGEISNDVSYFIEDEIKKEDIKNLIPIHPYSAYLLTLLSRQFSSSQRSLFKFLEGENQHGFTAFIKSYPKDGNEYWLTPDFIWDYFLTDQSLDQVSQQAKEIINYSKDKETLINDQLSLKIFKLIMLLNLLIREGLSTKLIFKPYKSNILSILKTTYLKSDIENKINELCDSKVIHSIKISFYDEEYTLPIMNIDYDELNEIQKKLEREFNFKNIISDYSQSFKSLFGFNYKSSLLEKRQYLSISSWNDFKQKKQNIFGETVEPYKIENLFILCLSEAEFNECSDYVSNNINQYKDTVILIIKEPFGENRKNEFISHEAYHQYSINHGDKKNEAVYKEKMDGVVNDYINHIKISKILVFFNEEFLELNSINEFEQYFTKIINKIFPYSPTILINQHTLITGTCGKASAEYVLGTKRPTSQYEPLIKLFSEFEASSLVENHPLFHIKEKIKSIFDKNGELNIYEAWLSLQNPPFGLFESPLGIACFTYALKDYANGYYSFDGVTSTPLNPDKLAFQIEQVCKDKKNCEKYSIRKLSEEAFNFCEFIKNIFSFKDEDCEFPDKALNKLKEYITQELRYPLWSVYFLKFDRFNDAYYKQQIKIFIDTLQELFLSTNASFSFSKECSEFLSNKDNLNTFKPYFTQEKIKEGFTTFLQSLNINWDISHDINTTSDILKQILNDNLKKEIYLWKEEECREKLLNIYPDINLISKIRKIVPEINDFFNGRIDLFLSEIEKNKNIPLFLYKEITSNNETKELIDCIINLKNDITKFNQDEKKIISDKIDNNKDELSYLFNLAKKDVLSKWIQQNFKDTINENNLDMLINEANRLNLLEYNNQKRLIEEINNILNKLEMFKLKNQLFDEWEKLTNTKSPMDWTNKNTIPIKWIINNNELEILLDFLDGKRDFKNKDEILHLLSLFKSNIDKCAILNNPHEFNKKFLEIIAPKFYESLIDIISVLKSDLLKKFSNADKWTNILPSIREFVENFIQKTYVEKGHMNLLKEKIKKLPEDKIRFIIDKLIEKAHIGLEINKLINNNTK